MQFVEVWITYSEPGTGLKVCVWWVVCKPIIVFSLAQAKQTCHLVYVQFLKQAQHHNKVPFYSLFMIITMHCGPNVDHLDTPVEQLDIMEVQNVGVRVHSKCG